jgi:hypothetical protein
LPFEKNFAEPKGCWKREIIDNPNEAFMVNPDDCGSMFGCDGYRLIVYDEQQSKNSLWFNSSNVVNEGFTSAKARFTSPRFSTVGNKDVGIKFEWYERVIGVAEEDEDDGKHNKEDSDKVTVQWSTDGANWEYLDEFKCQTSEAGWKNKTTENLPEDAEGQPAVYVSFLFEADGNNYGDR